MFPGKCRDPGQVAHVQERIGDGLDVEGLRVGPEGGPPFVRIVEVDKVAADAQRRQVLGKQGMGSAVEATLREQVVTGVQHGQQRGIDRRHAAGSHQRIGGALQVGQLAVQGDMVRGIVEPQVGNIVITRVFRGFIGGGLEHGLHQRPLYPGVRFPGMHRPRQDRQVPAARGHGSPPAITDRREWRPDTAWNCTPESISVWGFSGTGGCPPASVQA